VVFWVITLNSFVDDYYDSEETMTPPSQMNSTIPSFLTAIKFTSCRRQVSEITLRKKCLHIYTHNMLYF
jgi:hypothetical protein